MRNSWLILALIPVIMISSNYAYSQEIELSTFHESVQIIIDKGESEKIRASITLQSTSTQEIKIPSELEQKIRENSRIKSIVVTNQNECVLGVFDESCILINIERNPEDKGINAIQDSTKIISEQFIDEINEVFDTNAKFHSAYIHTGNESNSIVELNDTSGKRTISAVYTMPLEDTNSMYEKLSAILMPKSIREGGGFYDIAKDLSHEENSIMRFSLIPLDTKSLMQLKLSVDYPEEAKDISKISPLEFLKIENIDRSDYFSNGFYPLNSIIQIIILSPESTYISSVKGDVISTQVIDNEKIPLEITKKGWVFDPEEGQKIQGKYIFGQDTTIHKNELKFTLGEEQFESEQIDESIIVVTIISIVAIAAAIFYLKGYRR